MLGRGTFIRHSRQDTHRRERAVRHVACLLLCLCFASVAAAQDLAPVLAAGHPVQWWFVFKLNAGKFPGCAAQAVRACPFGGEVQPYTSYGQQYVFATDEHPTLSAGDGCAGDTTADPMGATFEEIYDGSAHYVVWNDQFYQDPQIPGCSGDSCGAPWGHSKGILAWDDVGQGLVMQVTTPSWPGSGSHLHPRAHDDNTLGCVSINDVKFSQHFFALRLTHPDVVTVLKALVNSSVVTDPSDPQVVSSGGPADIQVLVAQLGKKSHSRSATLAELSSGVRLISKPSALHTPPWQLVSSLLGGVPLRAATWWTRPAIPSTTTATRIDCWAQGLRPPGDVQIATTGEWDGTPFALRAGPSADGNHAKVGVSTDGSDLVIFGDLNQQGAVAGNSKTCARSQNGRGGLFFVLKNAALFASVSALIHGESAPVE